MADIAKLKKKALEHEQKKQFDKALALYIEVIEASAGASVEEIDVGLYNRVGDLLLKNGNVGDAVTYYERAVDLYSDSGFLNNAIALCNKILRQSPGRASVYYKLGKISAQKGFHSDARKNYLEYADRMQGDGKLDEAFRALAEFCDLSPGQDDVRLMLADQLTKQGKTEKALEQLQILHQKATADGRTGEADAAAERMRAINPSIVIKSATGPKHVSKADDLIFLDLNDSGPTAAPAAPPPAPVRAAAPPPPAPVELPPPAPLELEMPDALEMSEQITAPPDTPMAEPLDGLNSTIETPHLPMTPVEPMESVDAIPEVEFFDLEPVLDGGEDAATPRAPTGELPMLDLDEPTETPPRPSRAPTIEVAQVDLDAVPADEESALPLVPELEFLTPGSGVPALPTEDYGSDADAAAATTDASGRPSQLTGLPIISMGTPAGIASFGAEYGMPVEEPVKVPEGADDIEVAFATPPIVPVVHELDSSIKEDEMLDAMLTPMSTAAVDELPTRPSRKSVSILARSVDGLRVRLSGDPENWALRRSLGEALLEDGQRDDGLAELDAAMIGFEKGEDLGAARSVADEIVRVNPNSVRHHQKRVEYCFRSNDRTGLIDAYLELADSLLRDGQADKSRAVYLRVVELSPGDARAEAALQAFGPAPVAPPVVEPPRMTGGRSTTTLKRYTGAEVAPPLPEPEPVAAAKPPGGGDDSFVDLGDWLRDDEPSKNTRMVVDEEEPTGDEEADFADMLRKFKQGVADNVDEEDYDSHYDLGVAYKEMGLLDEAIAEFQKALRGTNHRTRAYEALGQCFMEKEHYAVAATILQSALAEPSSNDASLVGVLYLLGLSHEALNKPAEALAVYQRVFAVEINFRDVAERIKALTKAAK